VTAVPNIATTTAVPDIDAVIALIREAAAAEIMPRFRALADHEIGEKASGEVVTEADIAAEKFLTRALAALVPGSHVVGEEAAAENPDSVDVLQTQDPVWVIDPVDGTRNFVDGKPRFAVIIAYNVAGRTRAGWIHDPVRDVTATAVEGEGAWLEGTRLQVSDKVPVGEMSGSVAPRRAKRLAERAAAKGAAAPAWTGRYRCVGHEYLDLARGELQFAEYGMLKPWDHLAGILIHREAGGTSAMTPDGVPYAPGVDTGRLLLATDRDSWRTLAALLPE
jgi:fructose-1,6-bisphosphatase/inositol monophosphatase family enzyme